MAGHRRIQTAQIAAGAASLQARALATIANAYWDDPEVAQQFLDRANSYEESPEAFAQHMPEIAQQLLTMVVQQQQQEQTDG